MSTLILIYVNSGFMEQKRADHIDQPRKKEKKRNEVSKTPYFLKSILVTSTSPQSEKALNSVRFVIQRNPKNLLRTTIN